MRADRQTDRHTVGIVDNEKASSV